MSYEKCPNCGCSEPAQVHRCDGCRQICCDNCTTELESLKGIPLCPHCSSDDIWPVGHIGNYGETENIVEFGEFIKSATEKYGYEIIKLSVDYAVLKAKSPSGSTRKVAIRRDGWIELGIKLSCSYPERADFPQATAFKLLRANAWLTGGIWCIKRDTKGYYPRMVRSFPRVGMDSFNKEMDALLGAFDDWEKWDKENEGI